MSTVAVLIVIAVALLLAAMLTAAVRHSAARHAHHGPSDDTGSFRSHAEASRGDHR